VDDAESMQDVVGGVDVDVEAENHDDAALLAEDDVDWVVLGKVVGGEVYGRYGSCDAWRFAILIFDSLASTPTTSPPNLAKLYPDPSSASFTRSIVTPSLPQIVNHHHNLHPDTFSPPTIVPYFSPSLYLSHAHRRAQNAFERSILLHLLGPERLSDVYILFWVDSFCVKDRIRR
jgi:hypothetical protein